MKRLFVDVTQLVHQPGALAGIPRVMNELGVRFYKQRNKEVVFVSWVKELKSYCEIDFAKTMSNRGRGGIAYLRSGDSPAERNQAIVSATAHMNEPSAKTGGSADGLSAKKLVKLGISGINRLHPPTAEAINRRISQLRAQSYKKVQFKSGDAVFIGWGEWWDDNFIAMLRREHSDNKLQIIQVIHDLGPIFTPQFSSHSTESLTKYCQKVVPICSLVLVVSKHAKGELERWLKAHNYPIPPIRVFRNGDDFSFAKKVKPASPPFKESGVKGGDYILAHGTVEIRKNHMLYYYVYKLAQERGIKLPPLLVSGNLGWNTGPLHELITKDPEIGKKIFFVGGVTDEELSWLFDNALFSMYVSFYEGWGVPVAESLARGTPCITANVGSMLEIADGIAYYSSPASTDELLDKMQFLLKPKNLAAAKERTKKYKPTSWDDSFDQISQHIKEVIK